MKKIYLLLALPLLLSACAEDDTLTIPDTPRLSQIAISNLSSNISLEVNYTYNNEGQISFAEVLESGEVIRSVAYEYDGGRAVSATISEIVLGQLVPLIFVDYSYNESGNRVTITSMFNPAFSSSDPPSATVYFFTGEQISSITRDTFSNEFFFENGLLTGVSNNSPISDPVNDIASSEVINPLFSQDRIVAHELSDSRISIDLRPYYNRVIENNSVLFEGDRITFYEATIDQLMDDLPIQMTVEGEEVYTFTYSQ